LGFATQVLLARLYGPALLGFYVLGFTLTQVANIFAQFGMNSGVVRYAARYEAEGDAARVRGTILLALCAAFSISLTLAAFIFFGAGLLADRIFHEPSLEAVFRIFAVSLPFWTVMIIALRATQGFQTMKYVTYVEEIQRPLLNLVLIVAFYVVGAQVLGAVVAFVLSMMAGTVLALRYLKGIFPKLLDRSTPPKFEARALFSAFAPMALAQFMPRVNSWVATFVLGTLPAASAVGILSIVTRTAALSVSVFSAFRIFSHMVSGLYSKGHREQLSAQLPAFPGGLYRASGDLSGYRTASQRRAGGFRAAVR
jgi:O-antigen/teichoic acid export membrane protein